MKHILKPLFITIILATLLTGLHAQAPPHPNGGAAPTTGVGGNTPVGAGAALGDGPFILMALALAYGSRKVYVKYTRPAVEA